jgi:hypothetical protein
VDSTTLEANAAMKSIVRRDTGQNYPGNSEQLAEAEGVDPGDAPVPALRSGDLNCARLRSGPEQKLKGRVHRSAKQKPVSIVGRVGVASFP